MSDDMRYLSIMTNDNSINIVCHAGGKKSPYKAALKWIRLHISTPIKLESASQCLCLDIFVCSSFNFSIPAHSVHWETPPQWIGGR